MDTVLLRNRYEEGWSLVGGSFHRRPQRSGPGDRHWEAEKRLVVPQPPWEGKGLDPVLKAMSRKQPPLCLKGSSGSNGKADVLFRASFLQKNWTCVKENSTQKCLGTKKQPQGKQESLIPSLVALVLAWQEGKGDQPIPVQFLHQSLLV